MLSGFKDVRRRMGQRRLCALALAASSLAVGCGGGESSNSTGQSAASGELTTLRVPYAQGFGSLSMHVADEKGFFERNGLKVEPTLGLDTAAWIAAIGRQFDIVMTTPVELISAASRGVDAVSVSGMQLTSPEVASNPLMTKDPSIKSAADLSGKRVALVSLAGGSYAGLLYLLDQAGVDRDEVKLVAMPFATMADQLEAGRVDAAVSAIGFYTPLADQGYRAAFDVPWAAAEQAGATGPVPNAFFATSSTFAEENPDVIAAFQRSVAQGIAWIEANDKEARQILAEWMELSPEVADSTPLPAMSPEITAESMTPFVTILDETGLVDDPPEASTLVAKQR